MKMINAVKIIFCASIFLASTAYLHAENYDEDACFKDYITEKGKALVLAVNRDTATVESYWSEAEQQWKKPDEKRQKELQKIYNMKLRLLQMQAEMDRMHQDTWYDSSYDKGSHR